jgi:hypothetical protein
MDPRVKDAIPPICAWLILLTLAQAQSNVTTTGGTVNTVPKFSGASTVVNSQIVESNGNVTIGPVALPAGTGSGVVAATGNVAGFSFLRRTLTTWPSSPAAGDAYAWYNPDGTARLWTYTNNDLLTISPSVMSFGPFATPSPGPSYLGIFNVTGNAAQLGFVRRSLTSWPTTPAAGDSYAWYNPDGTARLWTPVNGDAITVTTAGNLKLDIAGSGIVFPDGSTQTKAQVQGPAGPAGPQGATGPQGPPGPTLHSSASCFNQSVSNASCGCSRTISAVVVSNTNTCQITSDTGGCGAGSSAFGVSPPQYGYCCVCAL